MDKEDKPGLVQSTRRPFKSRDLALSRELNRQGQIKRAIPYIHKHITRSLHSIFNHPKDIVYRRSSSILISVIRTSYRKIKLNECPFNIQRRLGLGVEYMAILVKVPGSRHCKLLYLRFFYFK